MTRSPVDAVKVGWNDYELSRERGKIYCGYDNGYYRVFCLDCCIKLGLKW